MAGLGGALNSDGFDYFEESCHQTQKTLTNPVARIFLRSSEIHFQKVGWGFADPCLLS